MGTTRGYMQLLDLRAPGKCVRTFTTFTGSVTSIACDPQEPLVATTSLDRYLRVHHLETKELVYKVLCSFVFVVSLFCCCRFTSNKI